MHGGYHWDLGHFAAPCKMSHASQPLANSSSNPAMSACLLKRPAMRYTSASHTSHQSSCLLPLRSDGCWQRCRAVWGGPASMAAGRAQGPGSAARRAGRSSSVTCWAGTSTSDSDTPGAGKWRHPCAAGRRPCCCAPTLLLLLLLLHPRPTTSSPSLRPPPTSAALLLLCSCLLD